MAQYERPMSVEHASRIDNRVRELIQDPKKVLKGHVKEGMVVLELGCGPGFFTPEIARMVGKSGKVIAADMQEGMLRMVSDKVKGMDIEDRVELHKCDNDKIGISEKVDLALAFLVMHELADKRKTLNEIKSLLKPDGKLYIIELKMHPPKKDFEETTRIAAEAGFVEAAKPNTLLSRAIIYNRGT